MDWQMRALLLEVAGFLRLVRDGHPVSREEAGELSEKIGRLPREPLSGEKPA